MKSKINSKFSIISVTTIILLGFSFHFANADPSFIESIKLSVMQFIFAEIGNVILTLSSWFLMACGVLLNLSINLTLQIKQFIDNIPAIYAVWQAIRDITGLFIIFALLYMSIQMILDIRKTSFGEMMKNIIIAGVLINFSFFVVGVLIDASNIVSMQIFKQMSPTIITVSSGTSMNDLTKQSIENGNISDIFMSALNITQIYQNKDTLGTQTSGTDTSDNTPSWLRILIVSYAGSVMMLTTGLSFLFASLAFIIRLAILVFLIAFSPLWFAAKIIPQLSEYSNKLWKILYGQLVFMPVYLLLMYLALRIVNGTNFFKASTLSSSSGGSFFYSFIGLIANCVFVIVMLNIPLVAALSFGAGSGLLDKFAGAINAKNLWKKTGGVVGTNTVGRLATYTDKKLANTTIGNSYYGREIQSATIGNLANMKYGGTKTWEDKAKNKKDVVKKGREIDKKNDFNSALSGTKLGTVLPIGKTLKDSLDKMNSKEKLALGAKILKDRNVLKHLKSDDFDAIKKSEDISDEDKKEINDNRRAVLNDAISSNDISVVKHMVESMDGKDLMKIDMTNLTNPVVVAHLKSSQLKIMEDEGLDAVFKRNIGRQIDALGAGAHKSYGFIRKNRAAWL